MAVRPPDTPLPQRYRTIRRLGAGGMATVFLAEDARLGRRVAVKRLHADSPEGVARRFDREAKVGASLNHPNIVTVYDTAVDDEGVLIVMEYVDGETPSQALADGRVDPARAMEVTAAVAAALDHAHSIGVVHRDVKPGNVLLGRDGAVKPCASPGSPRRRRRSRCSSGASRYRTSRRRSGASSSSRGGTRGSAPIWTMAMRPRSLLAVGLSAAALAAGCGAEDDEGVAISIDGVAKPHYIADGDEVCAEGNRKLEAARRRLARRLEAGGEPTDALLERTVEEEIAPIAEERIDALRALEPPAGDEARVAEIYDAAERALERIEARPRLAKRADRVFGRASRLAAEYGFRECARRG